MYEATICLTIFAAFYILWDYLSAARRPPGPFRWPVVGNAFQIPTETPWRQFSEWGKQYGDLVSLRIFGRPVLVLNSWEAITDLYEHKTSIYSDKPLRFMGELSGFGRTLTMKSNDDATKEIRKLLYGEFGPRAVKKHTHILEENARRLCCWNIKQPEAYLTNIRRMATINIMRIAYGCVITEDAEADEIAAMSTQVMFNLSVALAPSRYFVNLLPILKYIPAFMPGGSFQTQAAKSRQTFKDYWMKPFDALVNRMKSGMALPSLLSNALEANGFDTNISNSAYLDLLRDTGAEARGAGTDTNVSTITSFFLAMVLYPDIQRRAQEEILSVIRDERLPKLSDRDSLPYVNALVKELLRWSPAAPCLSRVLRVPDVYRGFNIAAGTMVIANAWAITRNESWFPDPETFDPERHLNRDSKSKIPESASLAFGFGRRSCPASYVALDTVWITVAMTLATCTIYPEVDSSGNISLPEVKYTSGALSHPCPFSCRIEPRSETSLWDLRYWMNCIIISKSNNYFSSVSLSCGLSEIFCQNSKMAGRFSEELFFAFSSCHHVILLARL
ncbi:cytochrome P450 [Desarmillaria tabescens]|uniref:Cytochrome P450 n=1 Tax=Armillaria tabescens TaxID=1929756 RepID=A0AA39KBT1_ARMTA|nr:cytochrome P450 [Desarmillaria tabescens]KAK0458200.1 cytochrome P450 [Desarmillaria tabescens]